MSRLLLIEDEEVIRRALVRFLKRKQFDVTDVATIEDALETPLHTFDVVLTDLRLPGAQGTAIISAVGPIPVVVMTSHASVRSAVDAMQEGATDYIAKPFDHDELLLVLDRAMQRDRLGIRVAALEQDLARLIPASRRIDDTSLEDLAKHISAATGAGRHFLHGPPGSGREGVARAAHSAGSRAEGPLVVANTVMLDEIQRRSIAALNPAEDVPGLRAARHGTLVIRRPELLDHDTQIELAARLGDTNVALICVADEPAEELLKDDRLAKDFVVLFESEQHSHVRPLKERPHDVLIHAQRVISTTARRCGRAAPILDDAAATWLKTRDWHGEVLELEALLARATVLVRGKRLTLADIAGDSAATATALSLDGYFRWFVEFHQRSLSETELASRLGISRKALWERRQRSELPRPPD